MSQPVATGVASGEIRTALDARLSRTLAAYLASMDEALLIRAYELGRLALAEGLAIPELVTMHGRAAAALAGNADSLGAAIEKFSAATLFLSEALSPFEMTHRGYHQALGALRHLNEALEAEVKRIAHALHDEAGELFVSVYLALAELEQEVPESARHRLRRVNKLLNQAEAQLRGLSHELRPTMLDDLGWLPAIQFLAESVSRRAALPIAVHATADGRLSSGAETALYRTVQEALNNTIRHAAASSVNIELAAVDDMLICELVDDGVGFDATAQGRGTGLGLRGMRERLAAVGGRLEIRSALGAGTRIRVELPMAS